MGTRIAECAEKEVLGDEAAEHAVAGVSLGLYTDRFSVAGDMLSGVDACSTVEVNVSTIIVRSIICGIMI